VSTNAETEYIGERIGRGERRLRYSAFNHKPGSISPATVSDYLDGYLEGYVALSSSRSMCVQRLISSSEVTEFVKNRQ
jgi:hypothetical protein